MGYSSRAHGFIQRMKIYFTIWFEIEWQMDISEQIKSPFFDIYVLFWIVNLIINFYKYHVYLYNMFVLSSTQFYRSCGRFYGHNKLWKKSLNNNGSQALVARTTYFNLFVSIFIQSHVNIKLHVSTLYRY
jgi:hypothetical protein